MNEPGPSFRGSELHNISRNSAELSYRASTSADFDSRGAAGSRVGLEDGTANLPPGAAVDGPLQPQQRMQLSATERPDADNAVQRFQRPLSTLLKETASSNLLRRRSKLQGRWVLLLRKQPVHMLKQSSHRMCTPGFLWSYQHLLTVSSRVPVRVSGGGGITIHSWCISGLAYRCASRGDIQAAGCKRFCCPLIPALLTSCCRRIADRQKSLRYQPSRDALQKAYTMLRRRSLSAAVQRTYSGEEDLPASEGVRQHSASGMTCKVADTDAGLLHVQLAARLKR